MSSEQDRRQRLYRSSAIVLKRRELGEADRLLTVFSREQGKITLLAKGVRRPASRKAGHIEPFTHVDLLIARGKSLDVITQAETLEPHRALREDLMRSAWGYYVAELADAFTQDADPNTVVFDLLLDVLGRIDRDENPPIAVHYYELHLLAAVGFQPQLFRCVACHELLRPEANFFSSEMGGALCPKHGAQQAGSVVLPLSVLKILRFLQSRPWRDVAPLRLNAPLIGAVESIMVQYMVHHLERGVKSATFIDRLRRGLSLAYRTGSEGQR